ncbi:MAG TPA: TipAS antibiotic-recognition domain-containing protein, partial [Actinopolymorphaceae bacterium]
DTDALVAAWVETWRSGASPSSDRARTMAARHVEWLRRIPGTPVADGDRERSIELVRCLGDLYVEDENFATTYSCPEGAAFVRASLHEYARTSM